MKHLIVTDVPYFMVYESVPHGDDPQATTLSLIMKRAETPECTFSIGDESNLEQIVINYICNLAPISEWTEHGNQFRQQFGKPSNILMIQINQTASMIAFYNRRGVGNTIICSNQTKQLIKQQLFENSLATTGTSMWNSWSSMYTWIERDQPNIYVGYVSPHKTDNAYLFVKQGKMLQAYHHPRANQYWAKILV